MPAFGGLTPMPLRLGGGRPRAATIVDGINAGMGTAYDVTQPSTVYAQNVAAARAIAGVWSANQRAAYQLDPTRMTDFLPRWEAIMGITPASADTGTQRRDRVAAKFRALGGPTDASLTDACSRLLGDVFVGVEYTPLASAVMHWADTGEPLLWESTVAHILVRVTLPLGMPQAELLRRVGIMVTALDDVLPAWTTLDWGYDSSANGGGFWLDEENNLDGETFD